MFDYIELFYNPKRRHSYTSDLAPAQYESAFENGSQVSKKSVAIHFSSLGISRAAKAQPSNSRVKQSQATVRYNMDFFFPTPNASDVGCPALVWAPEAAEGSD